MRISDWSSDVCSSDLAERGGSYRRRAEKNQPQRCRGDAAGRDRRVPARQFPAGTERRGAGSHGGSEPSSGAPGCRAQRVPVGAVREGARASRQLPRPQRSEEHTSELQSLMRNSYAVFCLKKKNIVKKRVK